MQGFQSHGSDLHVGTPDSVPAGREVFRHLIEQAGKRVEAYRHAQIAAMQRGDLDEVEDFSERIACASERAFDFSEFAQ